MVKTFGLEILSLSYDHAQRLFYLESILQTLKQNHG